MSNPRIGFGLLAVGLVGVLIGGAVAVPLAAAPSGDTEPGASGQDGLPDDAVLEAQGAVIRRIDIVTADVFDPDLPGENNLLYRLANRLHVSTRPDVIRRQLLVREGDLFSRRLLDESERLLRRNRYLYDAQIRVVEAHGNAVFLEVVTRDVWTLSPGANLGRSGGANRMSFKVQDYNFLGTGKDLTVKQSSDVDRDSLAFGYAERNLLGTRVDLEADWSENSDGERRLLDVRRPFFSLDARWSAGLRVLEDDRIDPLYARGVAVDHFRHQETAIELDGGLSAGLRGDRVRRWRAGIRYEEHRFVPVSQRVTIDGKVLPPTSSPEQVPADRRLVYPWVGFESRRDRFLEAHSLDQMGRTEDLELGRHLEARLGWASPTFGADREAAILDLSLTQGGTPSAGTILLLDAGLSGRWGRDGGEDVQARARGRFYWRDFGRHLLYLRAEVDLVSELDPENQLLLGGDSGLRGYPLRYLDGEGRALLSLEQRFFTDLYPFRLAWVGAAVFVDIGRTWGEGLAQGQELLRNVGAGLRLSSSRSGLGSVLHLDVAIPLDGDDSIEGVQFLVQTKTSF